MNILILSSGSRVKLIEYFVKEFNQKNEKVYVADCSLLAPTLYKANDFFIVPKITEPNYLEKVIGICKENKISAVISLIDPELSLISKNKNKFKKNNIIPIVSEYDLIEICFNKYDMYKFLTENRIKTPATFINIDDARLAIRQNDLNFPLFIKPTCGSASINMSKIENERDLNSFIFPENEEYVIQEFIEGKEYGVDVYIDMITGEIIDIFIKEKLKMRAGETDKSISIECEKIEDLVRETIEKMPLKGPIDIDVFEKNGQFLISEINPRFGGGYLHAYENNHNFIKYIINNLNGIENKKNSEKFMNTTMMKFSEYVVINNSGVEGKC